MHISQLELFGFKSFARKTTFSFQPGISCIVGPNGCGKTNVVDAIRWVLGEQKTSVLRSDKMGDVVFSGTEHRRPLSYAEVSLLIHNDNGELPVEYTDVEITRRLYRSGESEYLINKVPVRLKDITDLFLDTGMGANAYSVIELKMIESILSESHEERKRLFEEAAGINKYKHQRRSTLRKLEATRDDLLRLSDIVLEIEHKVKTLKQQLRKFERYEKYLSELQETELSLARTRLFAINKEKEPLAKEIEPLKKLYSTLGEQIDSNESELQTLRTQFEKKEEELVAHASSLEDVRKKRGKYYSNDILWKEQISHHKATLSRLSDERRSLQNRLTMLREQVAEFEKVKTEIEPQYQKLKDSFRQERSEFEEKDQSFLNYQNELTSLQEERIAVNSAKARIQNKIETLKTGKEENINRMHLIQEKMDSEKRNIAEKKDELSQLLHSLQKINSLVSDLQERRQAVTDKMESISEDLKTLQEESLNKKAEIRTISEQIQFFRSLIESRQDFPAGARYVLDNPDSFPEIAGALIDFIQIPEEYRRAVESALSASVYYLLVKDRKSALKSIKKLQEMGKGGVTLIPVEDFHTYSPPEIPQIEGILGRLSDFISVPAELQTVISGLYGDCLVVERSAFDRFLDEPGLKDWILISESGEFHLPKGLLVSAPAEDSSQATISHKTRLKNLEKRLKATRLELNAIDEKREKIIEELNTIRAENEKINIQYNSIQSDLTEKKDRAGYLDNLISQREKYLEDLQLESAALNTSIEYADTNQADMEKKLREAEENETRLLEKLNRLKTDYETIRSDRESRRKILREKELELVKLENEIKNTIFRLNSLSESIEDVSRRLEEIKREESQRQDLIKELQSKTEENAKNLSEAERELQEISNRRDEIQLTYNDLRREIVTREDTLRRLHRERETLLEKIRDFELQLSSLQSREEQITDRILEKYKIDLRKEKPEGIGDIEKLEKRVAYIQRQIESIGSINMTVREEFEKENSRYEFLKSQQQDLEEAEKSLQETIKQIDKVARKQFKETLEEIRGNFKKTYQMFFENGEADLLLVGDPDPLEAMIDIVSRPGGKKMQPLRMLSAGEKALTAIALLFAIYLVKPSPFCILDEVDAPLDDSNISKFTKVLNEFSRSTQFIVVTHNKMTMDVANTLYGVTMEESGISKVVSVKLE